jgi:hypothetical protein
MDMGVRDKRLLLMLMAAMPLVAQTPPQEPDWRRVVERLERLEEQNKQLLTEVRALREELAGKRTVEGPLAAGAEPAAAAPPLNERVEVLEQRSAEHEQTKVGTEHRFPVQLSGMMLFNAYIDGRNAAGVPMPVVAGLNADSSPLTGGTFRQSILGFKFQGPKLFAGGEVTGAVSLDLFAGTGVPLNQALRLRVASVDLAWTNTTVTVAQDKPIIAPREPVSLAQVGISPLTAAGNLWYWQPQIRVEQRFHFNDSSGLRAQLGVIQTNEASATVPNEYISTLAGTRPGVEGRFELWKAYASGARVEIGSGFHASQSHVEGNSVPARVYSVDWLIRPFARVDLTGTWFYNKNSAILGGLRPGGMGTVDCSRDQPGDTELLRRRSVESRIGRSSGEHSEQSHMGRERYLQAWHERSSEF